MVTYAQKWTKETHPADEMLNAPAWTEYTYEDSHVYLSFAENGYLIYIDMNPNYGCFYGAYPELQIGFYDSDGKYLRKKTIDVTGGSSKLSNKKLCFITFEDEELITYLQKETGKIRFVAKGFNFVNIDFKIPCFNNH